MLLESLRFLRVSHSKLFVLDANSKRDWVDNFLSRSQCNPQSRIIYKFMIDSIKSVICIDVNNKYLILIYFYYFDLHMEQGYRKLNTWNKSNHKLKWINLRNSNLKQWIRVKSWFLNSAKYILANRKNFNFLLFKFNLRNIFSPLILQ